MAFSGVAVAYCVVGGLLTLSGIKGSTIASTVQGALKGNLGTISDTESVDFNAPSADTDGSAGGTDAPAGPATSGSQVQNGTTIYKYLRNSGGYSPMQAAGAIASIWGESEWDPEANGDGAGLIQWTPKSKLPASALTGNAAADMSAQLPLILDFVSQNGDTQAVASMASASTVTQAATIWGQQVERYGISDVHAQGVDLAVQIARSVDGISLPAGT